MQKFLRENYIVDSKQRKKEVGARKWNNENGRWAEWEGKTLPGAVESLTFSFASLQLSFLLQTTKRQEDPKQRSGRKWNERGRQQLNEHPKQHNNYSFEHI